MQDLASILNKESSVSSRLNAAFNRSVKIEITNQENLPSMRTSLPSIKVSSAWSDKRPRL